MILVDTSIWADHFRRTDTVLADLLQRQLVAIHPFVIGELAMGYLNPRKIVLELLQALPQMAVQSDQRVLQLIEADELIGIGIGYIDAHLLAAVRLREGFRLWTRDRRLGAAALRLGVAFEDG